MKKIFWENPYQADFMTTVTFVEGGRVLLAETIAFSGGQESDKAWINDHEVMHSEIEGHLIY